jgi:molecular chaperone GrpE
MKTNNRETEKDGELNPEAETSNEQNPEPDAEQTPELENTEPEKVTDDSAAKIAELNDKYLRLYSEFDNYRRRTSKERIELTKTAGIEIISDLLPVVDDFQRALKSMEIASDIKSVKEGVELIYNKLNNTLSKKGLEAMDSKGKEFNPDLHEAITNIPAPSEDLIGKVIDEVEKGYTLNGKVIRYAKVVVGN